MDSEMIEELREILNDAVEYSEKYVFYIPNDKDDSLDIIVEEYSNDGEVVGRRYYKITEVKPD